jgi:hypothetical protein
VEPNEAVLPDGPKFPNAGYDMRGTVFVGVDAGIRDRRPSPPAVASAKDNPSAALCQATKALLAKIRPTQARVMDGGLVILYQKGRSIARH